MQTSGDPGFSSGLLGASRELVPTFEEHISGTSSAGWSRLLKPNLAGEDFLHLNAQLFTSLCAAGPVELVVLKGEDEDRDDALFGGLSSGLGAGCEAVLVVEVVKAQLVFNNIWQVGTQCEALQPRGRRHGRIPAQTPTVAESGPSPYHWCANVRHPLGCPF